MNELRDRIVNIWENHRRGSILAIIIVVMVIAAIGLNVQWLGEVFPTSSRVEKQLTILQYKQELLRKALERENELLQPVRAIGVRSRNFWQPERDGDPHSGMRRKIEEAARDAGVKLKSLGTLQVGKIMDGVNTYEMNVNADAQIGEIAGMMGALERTTPRFYWKTVTMNPDNIRNPRFLVFYATVKVVAVSAPELQRQLWASDKEVRKP